MIDIDAAKKLAVASVHRTFNVKDDDVEPQWATLDEDTIIKEYGWIFSVVPYKYLKTGSLDFAPPMGMGDTIVEKDGTVHQLGSSRPRTMMLHKFEIQFSESLKEKYNITIPDYPRWWEPPS